MPKVCTFSYVPLSLLACCPLGLSFCGKCIFLGSLITERGSNLGCILCRLFVFLPLSIKPINANSDLTGLSVS
uniref:Putative secreted protein n=1 Tax=Anopheles marajoara TaxID=58244 RepID=A0A2M4CDR1_9DIPT